MLEKTVVIDRLEILPELGIVQVRVATVITDGVDDEGNPVIISKSYHRKSIAPEDEYSSEPDEVKAAVAAVRNPELIASYLAAV